MKVEHTLAGFHRAKEGIFLCERERSEGVDGGDALQWVLGRLAPINVNEKGTEISVLVQDRNGCMQSR